MVVVLDTDSIIRYANPSTYRILGYKPEEVVGQHFQHLLKEAVDANVLVDSSYDTVALSKVGESVSVHMYIGELKDMNFDLLIVVIKEEGNARARLS